MDGPLTGDNSSSFEGLGRTTRSARATISDGIQADVNIFWAFSAALLAAAVAFMALQLTLGRKWMLAKVGARRCRDRKLLSLVSRVANELGVRMPRVYLCKGGPNAFVVGYPVSLVIASSLRSCLSDAELSLAVRHELSHVKNRDLILKPLLQSLRMIFFYNPAVHVIVRRMLDERELEADRRSTGSRSEKLHLMTALVKIHDDSKNDGSSGRPMQSASTLRARGHRGQLSERFDNLFASGRARPLRAFSICLLILFANLSILGVPSALLRASEPSAWSDGFASHAPMSWHSAGAKGMFPHSGLMPVFGSGSAGIPQPQKANLSAILSDPQVYAGEVVLVENITVLSAEKNTLSITDGTGTATVLVERFSDLPGHRSIPAR
jgi:beta-lactamase regulating signal transducer with metallopeptidase domain